MTTRPDTLRAELCEAFGVTVVHVARTGSWIAIAERGDAKHEVTRATRAGAEDAALDLCGAPRGNAPSPTPAPSPVRPSWDAAEWDAAARQGDAAPTPDPRDCQAPLGDRWDGRGPVRCGVTRPCPDHDRPATPADEAGEEFTTLLDRIDAVVLPFAAVQATFRDVEQDGEVLPDGTGYAGDHYETNEVMVVYADDTVEHFATAADARVAAFLATVTPSVVSHLVGEMRALLDARARAAAAVPAVVREAVESRVRAWEDLIAAGGTHGAAMNTARLRSQCETMRAWLRATGGAEGATS